MHYIHRAVDVFQKGTALVMSEQMQAKGGKIALVLDSDQMAVRIIAMPKGWKRDYEK